LSEHAVETTKKHGEEGDRASQVNNSHVHPQV
jgi:hypothetical protein